jgi:hypothetical protein
MSKEPITLSTNELRVVNFDLSQSAQEQKNDAAPPRLPRLSKPPEAAQEAGE